LNGVPVSGAHVRGQINEERILPESKPFLRRCNGAAVRRFYEHSCLSTLMPLQNAEKINAARSGMDLQIAM
jgi:hypothetical protein